MASRSRLGFVVGSAVFLIGAVAAGYFALRDSGGGSASDVGPTSEVLVAARSIPSGVTGSNAVAQALVERRAVAAATVPDGALTEFSQLTRTIAIVAVPQGQIITAAQFPEAQTRIGTIRIPDGRVALAIQMENVPGVAGFAGAGDGIDIFGVVRGAEGTTSNVKLVMQGIEVLNVNGTIVAPTQGQPGGAGLVFLLAVTPAEAEQLIYLTTFERLYFSLVPREGVPVPSTPGAGPADALRVG